MNATALKSELYKLIRETKDIHLLEQFKNLINTVKNSKENTWWEKLPEQIRESIEIGLKEAEAGEYSSHDDFMMELKEKYPALKILGNGRNFLE